MNNSYSRTDQYHDEDEEPGTGRQSRKKYLAVAAMSCCLLLLVTIGTPLIVWKTSGGDHSSKISSKGAPCGPAEVVQQSLKVTFRGRPSDLQLFSAQEDTNFFSFWQEAWDRIVRSSYLSIGNGCAAVLHENLSLALVVPNDGNETQGDFRLQDDINSSLSEAEEAQGPPTIFIVVFAMNVSWYDNNRTLTNEVNKEFALIELSKRIDEAGMGVSVLAVQEENEEDNYTPDDVSLMAVNFTTNSTTTASVALPSSIGECTSQVNQSCWDLPQFEWKRCHLDGNNPKALEEGCGSNTLAPEALDNLNRELYNCSLVLAEACGIEGNYSLLEQWTNDIYADPNTFDQAQAQALSDTMERWGLQWTGCKSNLSTSCGFNISKGVWDPRITPPPPPPPVPIVPWSKDHQFTCHTDLRQACTELYKWGRNYAHHWQYHESSIYHRCQYAMIESCGYHGKITELNATSTFSELDLYCSESFPRNRLCRWLGYDSLSDVPAPPTPHAPLWRRSWEACATTIESECKLHKETGLARLPMVRPNCTSRTKEDSAYRSNPNLPPECPPSRHDHPPCHDLVTRWLREAHDPSEVLSWSEERYNQRYALAVLYCWLNGKEELTDNDDWVDANVHECDWYTDDWPNEGGPPCNDDLQYRAIRPLPNMTGSLPSVLGLLTHLEVLDLTSCSLTGTIPVDYKRLVHLEELRLGHNWFEGENNVVWRLPSLIHLELNENALLSGAIPDDLNLVAPHLQYINLNGNQFHGTLPIAFDFMNLTYLILSYNDFSGTIPEDINLEQMKRMNLDHNNFEGEAAAAPFQEGTQLEELTLHQNPELTGDLNGVCQLFVEGNMKVAIVDKDNVLCQCCGSETSNGNSF